MATEDFIVKGKKNTESTPLELEVAKACAEICESSTSAEAKAAVANIKIVSAREVDVSTGKKALVIVVAYTAFKLYVKPNHQRVLTELEKKLKRHVVLIAARTMMRKNTKRPGLRIRPRSRTLTSVHNGILEDMVSPYDIVGKRIRTSDGARTYKILLDPRDRTKENLEEKLVTFSAAYKALTSKDAEFSFADYVLSPPVPTRTQ